MNELQKKFKKINEQLGATYEQNRDGYNWEGDSILVTLNGGVEYRCILEPSRYLGRETAKIVLYCDILNASSIGAADVHTALTSFLKGIDLIVKEFPGSREEHDKNGDGWWHYETPDQPVDSLGNLVQKYVAIGEQFQQLERLE